MSRFTLVSALGFLTLVACSSGSSPSGTSGGLTITIAKYTFSPDPLVAPAGSTITVINNDVGTAHTATSEAMAASYAKGQASPNGFTFDTGQLDGGGTTTITIPAGVPSGTVQPYFCQIHQGMMDNPNPTIKIQ